MNKQQHTPEPFVREPRYLVFKINDVLECLSACQLDHLQEIGEKIAAGRSDDGKPPFNAVVVEQDWPEFDLVWEMIEARMTGHGNDSRRYRACVNACAGISTENLEDNLLVKELARRYNEIIKQRDELLAALEQFATWGRMQYKAQSKGCHATFDMMALKDEIDLAESTIANVKGGAA